LEQTNAQLAAIVRSSGEAMVSMTPDLVITTWNAAAERLFGYAAAEVIGHETTMIPDELRGRFEEILKLVRAGSDQSYETRRRRKDGTLLNIAVTLSAIRDSSGAITGYCTVSRDITERLRAEAELAVARAERDVRADRDRIADDLRDRVIQRVYAAGLTLQGIAARTGGGEVTARIEEVITELDTSIAELRGAIFRLYGRTEAPPTPRLRDRFLELVTSMVDALGFTPAVTFTGPIDEVASEEMTTHLLAVTRETLSNMARHARASAAELTLTADGDLTLLATDNGVGLGVPGRRSGLLNMRWRAETLGGTFSASTASGGGGTRVEWRIPAGS